jgi:hypothetical protein
LPSQPGGGGHDAAEVSRGQQKGVRHDRPSTGAIGLVGRGGTTGGGASRDATPRGFLLVWDGQRSGPRKPPRFVVVDARMFVLVDYGGRMFHTLDEIEEWMRDLPDAGEANYFATLADFGGTEGRMTGGGSSDE